MPKKVKHHYKVNVNEELNYLLKKGFKVYAVNISTDKWKIEWQEGNSRPRQGKNTYVGDVKINEAKVEAIKYLYNTLKSKEL